MAYLDLDHADLLNQPKKPGANFAEARGIGLCAIACDFHPIRLTTELICTKSILYFISSNRSHLLVIEFENVQIVSIYLYDFTGFAVFDGRL